MNDSAILLLTREKPLSLAAKNDKSGVGVDTQDRSSEGGYELEYLLVTVLLPRELRSAAWSQRSQCL